MAVYKYRRIEDMPEPWEQFGDRNRAGRLRAVLSWARLAPPLDLPRGIRKFRSSEELAADRERAETARIAQIRAARAGKP